MAVALTLVDSFTSGVWQDEPRARVAFNSTGDYCAVGIPNDYGPGAGAFPAEVWVYKLAAGHWTRVAQLVTNTYWDTTEAWQVAISDNLTVLAIGYNAATLHRWKSTGSDTWASDSYFQINPTDNAGYGGVAISADGNVCVIWDGYQGGEPVKIYTGVSGTQTLRQTISTASDGFMAAALSSDGKRLLIGRCIGYVTSGAVVCYTSATLGTNSWTVASTVATNRNPREFNCLKMTADMSLVAVGGYTQTPATYWIEVFSNTSGTTYASLGSYLLSMYTSTSSFGLSDAGQLLVNGYIDTTPATLSECWSADDVSLVSGHSNVLDAVSRPAGLTIDNWCCCIGIDPTGAWSAITTGGHPSTSGLDKNLFCSIAAYVPPEPASEFWQDFVKTTETL